METFYYDKEAKCYKGIYDKRLSVNYYFSIIYPILNQVRKNIVYNNIPKAKDILQYYIKSFRKNCSFMNVKCLDTYFNTLIEIIINFISCKNNEEYYYFKPILEKQYYQLVIFIKNNKFFNYYILETIFNMFFGIELYVSKNIIKIFEISYVSL